MRFHCVITSYNFTIIHKDHCVYIKRHKGKHVLLSLYVDDILVVRNDLKFVQTIKRWLSSTFEMKDMRKTSYILEVKIHRDRSNKLIVFSQKHYIKKILERFDMEDCKLVNNSFARNENLSKTPEENRKMNNVPYFNAVGSLMYATMCTRANICYAIGMVSHYQVNPRTMHYKEV